ncbi:hypothetical protein BC938DRAFT_481901, partial [Jimgerdemannia flammicorona]
TEREGILLAKRLKKLSVNHWEQHVIKWPAFPSAAGGDAGQGCSVRASPQRTLTANLPDTSILNVDQEEIREWGSKRSYMQLSSGGPFWDCLDAPAI